jgi:glycosyltransferase involved in cell wall biosynthesis
MALRILHVLNDFPWPPTHGGRLDVWSRAVALGELGHDVDAVVAVRQLPSPDQMNKLRQHVRSVTVVERTSNLFGVLTSEPVQVRTRRRLSGVHFSRSYDRVLLEQEYVAPVLDSRSLEYGRLCLRVHNDESAYYTELARTEPSPWKRAYYRTESARFASYSRQLFDKVDDLWFISSDHYSTHRNYARAAWLPAALPQLRPRLAGAAPRVLIAGNLFQPTNLEAVEWYLDHVHPTLLHHGTYELWVAGSTRGNDARRILRRLTSESRVRVLTNVPDMAGVYRECSVFVNPMQHGVSVKMKTLDAICNGLPVVTTKVGAEGTGLRAGADVIICSSAVEMSDAIAALLESPCRRRALVQSATRFLAERYDGRAQLERLLSSPAPSGPACIESTGI